MNRMTVSCLLLAAVLGCAEINVRRVPQKQDYPGEWDQTKQKEVDSMDGLRFYLRRPFVAVHTPFPIASKTFILAGRVSADGKWVAIDMERVPDTDTDTAWAKVKEYVGWSKLRTNAAVPAAKVVLRNDPVDAPSMEPCQPIPPAQGGDEKTPEPPAKQTGIGTYKVRTDLDDVAVIPFRKYFDIVFLPDHDEQYVFETEVNFGAVSVDMTWDPGNTMLGLDAKVDNSAITAPLIEAYTGIVKAASKAVVGRINPVAAAQGAALTGREGAALEAEGGTAVTVIIHVVSFAAPGVYPILKPKELGTNSASAGMLLVGQPPAPVVAYRAYEEIFVEAALAQPSARYLGTRFAEEAGALPGVPRKKDGEKPGNKTKEETTKELNTEVSGFTVTDFTEAPDGSVHFFLQPADENPATKAAAEQQLKTAWLKVMERQPKAVSSEGLGS